MVFLELCTVFFIFFFGGGETSLLLSFWSYVAVGQNLAGTFFVGSLTTSLKGFQKGHRGYGVLTHSYVVFFWGGGDFHYCCVFVDFVCVLLYCSSKHK